MHCVRDGEIKVFREEQENAKRYSAECLLRSMFYVCCRRNNMEALLLNKYLSKEQELIERVTLSQLKCYYFVENVRKLSKNAKIQWRCTNMMLNREKQCEQ